MAQSDELCRRGLSQRRHVGRRAMHGSGRHLHHYEPDHVRSAVTRAIMAPRDGRACGPRTAAQRTGPLRSRPEQVDGGGGCRAWRDATERAGEHRKNIVRCPGVSGLP